MMYQIVMGETPTILENKVNQLVEEGWIPSGGMSIQITDHSRHIDVKYYQAMARGNIRKYYNAKQSCAIRKMMQDDFNNLN